MRARAVIGAGYGDEGKGALVDALSAPDTCVVRYNGGAQAGHTVCEAGRRHVFHHFGSGSFKGAKTHLSRYFVVNPILALPEMEILGSMRVTVSPEAPVTTPVEMMINQAIEMARSKRHGSCGLGFGETWEREEKGPSLIMSDVFDNPLEKVRDLVDTWLPVRCEALGLSVEDIPVNDNILIRFVNDWKVFLSRVRLLGDQDVRGDVIFEGAQGLGLDEDLGYFPHVTRSFTGSPNISTLALEMNFEGVDVYYATRAYATRHGAGPFLREKEWSLGVLEDETNVSNPWQGTLRFAPLDYEERRTWIERDCSRATIDWFPSLFVSCLDQVSGGLPMAKSIAAGHGLALAGYAMGKTRKDRIFCKSVV